MNWTKPWISLGKRILPCISTKLKIVFNTLLRVFFHSIVTDYNASCLLELEAVSNASFFFLHGCFKSFQCLFTFAAMPVPWACVPSVRMVPGSLKPRDHLCGRAGKNRAGELQQLTLLLLLIVFLPKIHYEPNLRSGVWMNQWSQDSLSFSHERDLRSNGLCVYQASGSWQPFCF